MALPYDPEYKGARFYRCDLQMQTPADRANWRGNPMGATAAEMDAAADEYLRVCFEAGLEVIAITDHNFASRHFLPHLYAAEDRLSQEFGRRIVIFPGFEFTANVGRGLHVLALFGRARSLDEIDHILTQCGVPVPRFRDGTPLASVKRLPEILEVVQTHGPDGLLSGVVILPHSQSASGIFDNDRISEWLQAEEFKNPRLLCLEVPKPPGEMSAGWRSLLGNGPDCLALWKRPRPIACIMSSDAKALTKEQCPETHVGSRSSWIKMSVPSIEGLRQAFLDHDSRISLGPAKPEVVESHARIRKIHIAGASFLGDTTIALSGNLTTLIGGRGAGKSTVIEYLRVLLAQSDQVSGDDARKNFEGIKGAIGTEAKLALEIEMNGQVRTIRLDDLGQPKIVDEPEITDVSALFPARVLSQREIYAIAEDATARLLLVDDIVRDRLMTLSRRAEDTGRQIDGLNRQLLELPTLRDRLQALKGEQRATQVKLDQLKACEIPLGNWSARRLEAKYLEELEQDLTAIVDTVETALDGVDISESVRSGPRAGTPSSELLTAIHAISMEALEVYRKAILDAGRALAEALRLEMVSKKYRAREEAVAEEEATFDGVRQSLIDAGTDPDGYLSYQELLESRAATIADTERKVAGTEILIAMREGDLSVDPPKLGLLRELRDIWDRETAARREAAARLVANVPRTRAGDPFLSVTIEQFGDTDAFLERMVLELKDGRRITQDDWSQFMRAAADQARLETGGGIPATELLARWMGAYRTETPAGCPWPQGDRRWDILSSWLKDSVLQELRIWRVPDKITVTLFREDGSRVGDLDGHLSVGQRCTAVLALLLAAADFPLIVDQPEEDLDNEFIFSELVPLLRRVKTGRQLIVATHNANIPVNGDAELVVALEVREGYGQLRLEGNLVSLGGLDLTPVKRAVEKIMEGSQDAFRRRLDKYGF